MAYNTIITVIKVTKSLILDYIIYNFIYVYKKIKIIVTFQKTIRITK